MKIDFNKDGRLNDDEINVLVSAKELTPEVIDLLAMLKNVSNQDDNWIPVNTNNRVQMVAISNIVGIEIYQNELNIYTNEEQFVTNGTLKDMYEKLKKHHFIQISKSAIINIDHLDYMETAFSGNMTAFLTNDLKLNVSRKYLPGLKKSLRM
ncbi:LytTR family DNA-binding domain-containing protein [Apilactobacillus kunkeei]|uniref:Putative transcriptional regulator,LytR/AlgR family n=1 Tax=Apilactobacillus kunkeei TaxID=148814 RepID=A0A0N0CTI2_9LACO|nr:LytTR family DNA-binding domain-containing protein [Apilactobacillus kunkeei]KOY78691.1 putative transcriptional regulator,LytR/AlgR family [Apilactobacillus kunkeei]